MKMIDSNSNMINPAGEVVIFYNNNSRLTVLVNRSLSIRDLEAKVL